MPIVFLLASGGLLGLLAVDLRMGLRGGWRVAFLKASLILGLLVWVISEALGAVGAIEFRYVLASWVLVGFSAIALAIVLVRRSRSTAATPAWLGIDMGGLTWPSRAVVAYLVGVVALLALVAFVAAPNTADSMIYHLSRVMHWQQNRSLDFYPTSIQRQLAFSPWAEIAILQFQILTGGDRLANFIQFFAFVGTICGASLIAKALGGGMAVQLLAAFACATLPMAILQATSTQNDLMVAFWCTTFVALLLSERSGKSCSLCPWLGAALGLAVLTKVTALVYLAPYGIWYAVEVAREKGFQAWRPLACSLGIALLVLLPHSLRNLDLYGNPLGVIPGPELGGQANEVLGVSTLVSNVLRTSSVQLAVPGEGASSSIEDLVRAVHGLLGLDPDDPQTTWRRTSYEVVFSMYENRAANPVHFLLIAAGVGLLLFYRTPDTLAFGLSAASAFLLFNLAIKWQPWNSRLILPILIWGLILAALQLSRWLPGYVAAVPVILIGVLTVPYLVANPSRPLAGSASILRVDRLQQYFTGASEDPAAYIEGTRLISQAGCHDIGLITSPEGREYLLWAVARERDPDVRIEHIEVRNRSRRYVPAFVPCAVVTTRPTSASSLEFGGRNYQNQMNTERFSVFLVDQDRP